MRPQRFLSAALTAPSLKCRAEVDIWRTKLELRVMPNGSEQEVLMDLVVTLLGSVQPLHIDVSIGRSHVQQYGQAAACLGEAADAAVADKRGCYGSEVFTFALESYRRFAGDTRHACRGVPPRPVGSSQTCLLVACAFGTHGQHQRGLHRPAGTRLRADGHGVFLLPRAGCLVDSILPHTLTVC
ncbi:unnamed protein product [Prorocentrum cordatum]|uniref:Uncharacterized protein n=1 Tax=Prorocentrum cordatum TaxID=2364126 RepID=A0ABN9PQ88_9DINO|nr:unnamed protein product [Polarella glacialis]